MTPSAFDTHQLSVDFLKAFPVFEKRYRRLADFIGDSPVLCHGRVFRSGCPFDTAAIDAECRRCSLPTLFGGDGLGRPPRTVRDTMTIARAVVPLLDPRAKRKFYSLAFFHEKVMGTQLDARLAHGVRWWW